MATIVSSASLCPKPNITLYLLFLLSPPHIQAPYQSILLTPPSQEWGKENEAYVISTRVFREYSLADNALKQLIPNAVED